MRGLELETLGQRECRLSRTGRSGLRERPKKHRQAHARAQTAASLRTGRLPFQNLPGWRAQKSIGSKNQPIFRGLSMSN
jgi:hypothetical protein